MSASPLENTEVLKERFKKTLDILVPTLNYVDSLDESERDYCEETFYQISPCYLYMYSVVVDEKIPDSYKSPDAQLEMFDQLKKVAQISAATFKMMRDSYNTSDEYRQGFITLLETYLLMYYAYRHGLPK